MATIKFTNSKYSVSTVLKYITQKKKTDASLISGINCSPESAFDEMMMVKNMFGKRDGRQYVHVVQSFSPKEWRN